MIQQQAPKQDAPGFDIAGLARLHDERCKRYAPIYAAGGNDLSLCMRLLHRNPTISSAVLKAIHAEMEKLPNRGVDMDQPLFDSRGQWVHGASA